MYVYEAVVDAVHDGDTITAFVNLGFRMWRHEAHFRLAGISARELSMPGGREARDHLARLLPAGLVVTVRSTKVDQDPADHMSFDRYVAAVTMPSGRDLAELLVSTGWAAPWDGRSKPTPYPGWPIATEGPA